MPKHSFNSSIFSSLVCCWNSPHSSSHVNVPWLLLVAEAEHWGQKSSSGKILDTENEFPVSNILLDAASPESACCLCGEGVFFLHFPKGAFVTKFAFSFRRAFANSHILVIIGSKCVHFNHCEIFNSSTFFLKFPYGVGGIELDTEFGCAWKIFSR